MIVQPEIVFQAEDEAVLFKPAGLSSERPSERGDGGLQSLQSWAARALGWPESRLPHRLDRPTRGLIVVARDADAAARHAAEIRDGLWAKWYLARIESPAARSGNASVLGEHRAYLRRKGKLAEVVRSGGDPSRLEVLACAETVDEPRHAHVLIRLWTGRYHQIRVMLAHAGFPLVGDSEYGGMAASRRSVAAQGSPLRRAAAAERFPRIDLESVALVRPRAGAWLAHRVRSHAARRGVADTLEDALDLALKDAVGREAPSAPRSDTGTGSGG